MEATTQKRKLAEDEVQSLNVKKSRLEKDIQALIKSADTFSMQVEENSDLTMVAKSNSMRRSAKEKTVELESFKN